MLLRWRQSISLLEFSWQGLWVKDKMRGGGVRAYCSISPSNKTLGFALDIDGKAGYHGDAVTKERKLNRGIVYHQNKRRKKREVNQVDGSSAIAHLPSLEVLLSESAATFPRYVMGSMLSEEIRWRTSRRHLW